MIMMEVLNAYPEFASANYYYAPKNGTTLLLAAITPLHQITMAVLTDYHLRIFHFFLHPVVYFPQATTMNPGEDGIYISRTDGEPITSVGGELIVQLSYNYSARIFLYGLNDELITFDTHGGSLGTSFKAMRALYSPLELNRFLLCQ